MQSQSAQFRVFLGFIGFRVHGCATRALVRSPKRRGVSATWAAGKSAVSVRRHSLPAFFGSPEFRAFLPPQPSVPRSGQRLCGMGSMAASALAWLLVAVAITGRGEDLQCCSPEAVAVVIVSRGFQGLFRFEGFRVQCLHVLSLVLEWVMDACRLLLRDSAERTLAARWRLMMPATRRVTAAWSSCKSRARRPVLIMTPLPHGAGGGPSEMRCTLLGSLIIRESYYLGTLANSLIVVNLPHVLRRLVIVSVT